MFGQWLSERFNPPLNNIITFFCQYNRNNTSLFLLVLQNISTFLYKWAGFFETAFARAKPTT